jgi:hypothetical protein
MGKPGKAASNIFQTEGIKNSPEKGRYSDPQIEGLGSPYAQAKEVTPKNAFQRNAVKSEGEGIFSKIADAFKRNALKGDGKTHEEAEKEVNPPSSNKQCACGKKKCNCG